MVCLSMVSLLEPVFAGGLVAAAVALPRSEVGQEDFRLDALPDLLDEPGHLEGFDLGPGGVDLFELGLLGLDEAVEAKQQIPGPVSELLGGKGVDAGLQVFVGVLGGEHLCPGLVIHDGNHAGAVFQDQVKDPQHGHVQAIDAEAESLLHAQDRGVYDLQLLGKGLE